MIRSLVAVAAAGASLFVWSGLSQQLPWGVSAAQNFSATSPVALAEVNASAFEPRNLTRKTPGFYTSAAFDEAFSDAVSTLATDRTFSWIISIPAERYKPMRYLGVEAITQVGIAVLLLLTLTALRPLPKKDRFRVLGLLALAGGLATYGVMMNWWGLPLQYAVGMVLNLLVGWFIAGLIVNAIIHRSERHA